MPIEPNDNGDASATRTGADADAIARALRLMGGDGVVAAARPIPLGASHHAVGRLCAAAALRELTGRSPDVPRGGLGEPVWPPGIAGSISHDGRFAAAIVVRADSKLAGIGVDLIDGAQAVATANGWSAYEEAWRGMRGPRDPTADGFRAACLLGAKEAAVKLLSPMIGDLVEPADLHVASTAKGDYVARLHVPPDRAGAETFARITVRQSVMNNVVISLACDRTTQFGVSSISGAKVRK